jgi:hypothetical protein
MNKQPLFFKDTGTMGDVLGEAQKLLEETKKEAQALEERVKVQKESVDEYREEVEQTRYRQVIRERIGEGVEDVRGAVAGMVTEWKDKKLQMKQREEELALQQHALEEREQQLESRLEEIEAEQRDRMHAELQDITQLSATVKGQMDELEKTKRTIDDILSEDEETLQDRVLTREDVDFLRLNYFSLLQSRLASQGVVNPLTDAKYSKNVWKVETTNEEVVARIPLGVLGQHTAVGFEIRLIVPEAEEGFVYQKTGKEVAEVVTGFIEAGERDKDSFGALVFVSPTGWTDWAIEKVQTILNMTKSVYLVDLNERTLFYNESDKKTKQFAEWFVPVPVEDEIAAMVTKLNQEIEEASVLQFRVDKVCEKYQAPRKIVLGAFNELVNEGKGEIITPDEGAKDSILLVR